jgi:HAD superfamily hydrolase (TIGR01509 family)
VANQVRAVLLDVDGTLLDSNDAHAAAWVDVGKEFGYEIDFARVRWLIGMGGDRVLPQLTGLTETTDDGERILQRRGELFRARYLPGVRTFAGARELLARLRGDGRRLVVATSASREDLDALLAHGGLSDLIDAATDSDEAEDSKPAPDIVEAALRKTGERAADVVMLGDTPYDVKASLRAGVTVIALRCGGWTGQELEGAAEIYEDPAELLARYEQSLLRT